MIAPRRILPIIIVSQFFCTSLWFASNAVMENLISDFGLKSSDLGHLTSSVQFGFICGTLLFTLFTISDRYSPSKVFFISAIIGAAANIAIIWEGHLLLSILTSRFITGLFLAGIYPVGMKIASDYFKKGLGTSLSYLVGALVLGTALPHLLQAYLGSISWRYVVVSTSMISVLGGILVLLFVPDGPYRKASSGIDFYAIFKIFKDHKLKNAALGYFGHMWELYTLWAFIPLIIKYFIANNESEIGNVSSLSFGFIAVGSIACIIGGYLSKAWGNHKIALGALLISGICCLLSPIILFQDNYIIFMIFMLIWGMAVIADSPQLSTMVADASVPEMRGSTLTIVNCIGFAITIVSIEVLTLAMNFIQFRHLLIFLGIGPLLGTIALLKNRIKIK